MNKKGFTLIELIVVIAIIAILAAVAVPSYINVQNQAKAQVERGNAGIIVQAINTHNTLFDANLSETGAVVPALSGLTTPTLFNDACDVSIDPSLNTADYTEAVLWIDYTEGGVAAIRATKGVAGGGEETGT